MLLLPKSLSHDRKSKMWDGAVVSFESLTEGGCASKPSYTVADMIQFLTGCWTEGFGSLLTVDMASLSSLLHGLLLKAAHNTAAGFHQNEKAREQEQGERLEYHGAKITRSHIRGCPPQCVTCLSGLNKTTWYLKICDQGQKKFFKEQKLRSCKDNVKCLG